MARCHFAKSFQVKIITSCPFIKAFCPEITGSCQFINAFHSKIIASRHFVKPFYFNITAFCLIIKSFWIGIIGSCQFFRAFCSEIIAGCPAMKAFWHWDPPPDGKASFEGILGVARRTQENQGKSLLWFATFVLFARNMPLSVWHGGGVHLDIVLISEPVAQICNLLYRDFQSARRRRFNGLGLGGALPNAIRRYGRFQICATSAGRKNSVQMHPWRSACETFHKLA